MPTPQLHIFWSLFLFAMGSCIGSFLNVVIWRLPHTGQLVTFKGKTGKLTLSWPPSHCPVCDNAIRPWHNVPIFGWLMLRGKCASCGTAIAVRYPLVELATGVLFVTVYLAYFIGGMNPLLIESPNSFGVLIVQLLMVAALLAASGIDIDLWIIPIEIPLFLTLVGVIGALLVNNPAMPTVAYRDLDNPIFGVLAKAAIGGTIGLILANILVLTQRLPRSFNTPLTPPPAPDAKKAEDKKSDSPDQSGTSSEKSQVPPIPIFKAFRLSLISALVIIAVAVGAFFVLPASAASMIALAVGIILFLLGLFPRDENTVDVTADVVAEITGEENVRGEILKEIVFILIPIAFAGFAAVLPWTLPPSPLLERLTGSLLGLLCGGGVVWIVRILGSLYKNMQAMGLGDVHLMAGVGAIIGAKLAVLSFFLAPFFGLTWVAIRSLMKRPSMMPYGPWLSIASIFSLFLGDPLISWYINHFLVAPATSPGSP